MRCTNIDVTLLRNELPRCSSRCSNGCSNRHDVQTGPRLQPDGARLAFTVLEGVVAGDTLFVGKGFVGKRLWSTNRGTSLVTTRIEREIGPRGQTRKSAGREKIPSGPRKAPNPVSGLLHHTHGNNAKRRGAGEAAGDRGSGMRLRAPTRKVVMVAHGPLLPGAGYRDHSRP